jgi:2-keto-4-pentenoate hydratase/2-oxohepta-3-ene-1,7-dioic acid hydratase in catechol pathway
MVVDASPEVAWHARLAVVVGPGPVPDPELDGQRLARHREFYLKSAHTVVPSGSRLRYRPALGRLTYRAQLGLLFDPTPRHTPPERILDHVRGVVLAAELASVDLLRVGWEGTMWHIRYGEGASFGDSCVVTESVRDPAGIVGASVALTDPWGTTEVDWSQVAEACAHVSDWMALRPDMLLLAGSGHGPVLSIEETDAVLRFGPSEPRIGPGDEVIVSSPQLGEVRATVGDGRPEGD